MDFIIEPQGNSSVRSICIDTGGCYYNHSCPGGLCSPDCNVLSLPCFFVASADESE